MNNGLFLATLVAYALGIAMAVLATLRRAHWARAAAPVLFVLAWLGHSSTIVQSALSADRFPLSNLGEYLLAFGWTVLTLHLYVWLRLRVDATGIVLPTIAALSTAGALAFQNPVGSSSQEKLPGWFAFHVTLATLGMAILCVAFAMSLLYLLQDRALKARKTLVLLNRFPSLETCDQVGYHALILGFALLSIGIASGVIGNETIHEKLWLGGAKQIFPLLSWSVFAAVLVARSTLGFRGRKSAYMTIAGFALGLMTVVGMTL